ncbi:MAG: serine/threonine-protein kinase [Thermoanaerobaculia bacterium]|nr:serine/threonine-protein kinase [Thermoanaerobaculia bacterium]
MPPTEAGDPQWAQVERALDALLEEGSLDEAKLRSRLAELCNDEHVRAEVEALWRAAQAESGLLERSLEDEVPELLGVLDDEIGADSSSWQGRTIGAYRLTGVIGRGGMGVVYEASRADEHFEKKVAVKLMPYGLETAEGHRRFLVERQILADLEHPNLARLLDGGVTPEGTPYLAMELVAGTPIDDYVARGRLPLAARLDLFRAVCAAVQYAHQHMVIHCDLKPSNILVTAEGEVKLLDFGVAKLIDPDDGRQAGPTRSRPLTPAFASPEQIRQRPVTAASDIYSLGVILYRLLTGTAPYDLDGLSPQEVESVVAVRTPEAASQRARTLEAGGNSPPIPSRRLRGDLDNIVAKALRKEPADRYATVDQLGEDLSRFLRGHPIAAREPTRAYRLGKFVTRHRAGVAATLLLAVSVFAGVAGVLWQSSQAAAEARRAEEVADFLVGLFAAADPFSPEGEVEVSTLLDRGVERIRSELAHDPAIRAAVLDAMGRSYDGVGDHERAIELNREALALRQAELGPQSPQALESAMHLGTALTHQGRYDEARPLLEGVLRSRQRLGSTLETAQAHRYVGELAQATGDYATAAAHLRRALAMLEPLRPDTDLLAAQARSELAAAITWLGEDAQAVAYLEEALTIAEATAGTEHPISASIRNNLALEVHGLGDYERAEALYHQTLEIQERTLGASHQSLGMTLTSLGKLLMDEGDYVGARPHLERAVALQGSELDADNFFRIATEINLATLLRELGETGKAQALYLGAIERFERILGDDNTRTARVRTHLGVTLWREGRLAEAEAALRRALAVQRGEETHFQHLAETLLGLGGVLCDRGRPIEAEPLLREALGLFTSVLDADNWQVAEARAELGRSLLQLGQTDEAAPLLVAAVPVLEASRRAADPRLERARASLAMLPPGAAR